MFGDVKEAEVIRIGERVKFNAEWTCKIFFDGIWIVGIVVIFVIMSIGKTAFVRR